MAIITFQKNKHYIYEVIPSAKIKNHNVFMCNFKCSQKNFLKLEKFLKHKGINIYSFMYWF